jgi:hypothetical protein
MTKPTPGPWRVGSNDPTRVYSERGNERLVAECRATGEDLSEAYANAHLIAAAPNLLAACRTAYARLNRFGDQDNFAHGGEGTLQGILWAAILEAEGDDARQGS